MPMTKKTAEKIFDLLLEEPRGYGFDDWCEDHAIDRDEMFQFIGRVLTMIEGMDND